MTKALDMQQWRRGCLLLFGILVTTASRAESDGIALPILEADKTQAVRTWAILGPCSATTADAFTEDFLAKTPLPAVPSDPAAELPTLPGAAGWREFKTEKEEGIVDLDTFFNDRQRQSKNTAAYAVAVVRAARARPAYLLVRADDELRVALNGSELFTLRGSRELGTYKHAVRLDLKPGNNLLVVKILNIAGGWGFSGCIAATDQEAAEIAYEQTRSFLQESSVEPGHGLALFAPGLLLEGKVQASVVALSSGERVPTTFVGNLEVTPPARAKGLYRVEFDLAGRKLTELFYAGTIAELAEDTEARFEQVHADAETMDGLAAYVRRVRIVADAAASSGDLPDWDRKVILENLHYKGVFAAGKFAEAVARLAHDQPAFRDVPGLSIGAFRSAIDGQVLHYRIYVPTNYRRGEHPLPLVVVVHPPFTAQRPFIAGPVIANQREAEQWSSLAEQLGVGLLWAGYRAPITGEPVDISHLEEVLQAVSRRYDLDPSRLTLWGECGSTMNTVYAVEAAPRRYAGVLLLNVALGRNIHQGLLQLPAYQAWVDEQDPLRIVTYPLPIYLAHDSADEGHGAIADTYHMSDAAAKAGHRIEYWVNLPDWPAPQPSTIRTYLTWLAQQRLEHPEPLTFHLAWPRGPIAAAFAEPFVVITPTAGPPELREAARKLATTFTDLWRKLHFGPCRVLEDREVTPETEAQYNLVLFGNTETNRVWQRLADRLAVGLAPGEARVLGDPIVGADAIQAWCLHPTVPGRKIVLIGGTNPADLPALPCDFCLRGWFDCSIWRDDQGTPQVMDLRRYPPDAKLDAPRK